MSSFVPKHKSYLKPRDLAYVPKPTKEEEDAKNEQEKQKSQIDFLFD